MKGRAISYTADMAQALMENRKWNTRWLIRPQPPIEATSFGTYYAPGKQYDGTWEWLSGDPKDSDTWTTLVESIKCPYGKPGDLLWVKEPWVSRYTSRLTLKITDIYIEKLQDISEEDAKAEGVELSPVSGYKNYLWHGLFGQCDGNAKSDSWNYQYSNYDSAKSSFSSLWESIYGKGSWEANPWVWVIKFKVIKQNIDDFLKLIKQS